MKGRGLLLLAVLALLSGACASTSMLSAAAAPTSVEQIVTVEPSPTVERPQSVFIDARDDVEPPVATPDLYSASAAGYGGCTPGHLNYTYIVHYGDTLTNIAARAGTTWQYLAQVNCIWDPNRIFVNQVLCVPAPVAYFQYIQYPHYPQYPYYPPGHGGYPPPHGGSGYPPPVYPTPGPTSVPPPAPVVVGSGLSFTPTTSINNNTVNLPPDVLITISWPGTFPTATDHVEFDLIAPGGGSSQAIGVDTNPGDGVAIVWNSVDGTQGTVVATAYFQGGYPPQLSDSYYVIAGTP